MKHNTSTSKKKALRGLAVGLALALTIAGGGLLSHRYGWFGDTPTAELPENPSKNPETGRHSDGNAGYPARDQADDQGVQDGTRYDGAADHGDDYAGGHGG